MGSGGGAELESMPLGPALVRKLPGPCSWMVQEFWFRVLVGSVRLLLFSLLVVSDP